MTYNVQIPEIVREKIKAQAQFIAQDKPLAALEWYDNIFEQIFSLEEMPMRCPLAPENQHLPFELRHLISGNYRLLFRIEGDTVFMMDFKERHQQK